MSMQITPCKVNACPKFWRDIKELQKQYKRKEFFPNTDSPIFDEFDDDSKIKTIPYSLAILNMIINCFPNFLDNVSDKYDRQPFLLHGWVIRKMRYAIDNRGKSHGVRIIYCTNGIELLLVLIAHKNKCENERDLEGEFLRRIRDYLSI